MVRKQPLRAKVAGTLQTEIFDDRYGPGARLPSETELAARFEVSRPTVRAALQELEALGLVRTQHGVGSFVSDRPAVQAGLERMDSITDSIRATGREPDMVYARRLRRHALPDEAAKMQVPRDAEVVELRRTILADAQVVAFSYDLLPASLLPEAFDLEAIDGSIFAFFSERLGLHPVKATAEVHAVHSTHIGWGAEAAEHDLFVLLDQRHVDADGRLLLYSRTYFIEGRYAFTVVRRR